MNNSRLFSFFLVSVTGGSACGKSFFIKKISEHFQDKITIISQDDYYKPLELQHKDVNGFVNFDLPTAIDHDLFLEHLINISNGQVVQKEEYTFNHPKKIPEIRIFKPNKVVLIEGLFVTWHPVISQNIDFQIFIEADESVCFERRRKRDTQVRGIPENVFLYQWNNHVLPAYRQYILKFRDQADLIIENNTKFQEGFQKAVELLRQKTR